MSFDEKTLKRFWSKVDKNGDCWLWTACVFHDGYGQFRISGKLDRAHRASWLINVGSINVDLCVLHRCDVRRCVRPDHLFLGTRDDNMQDTINKGRFRNGKKHSGSVNAASRLTEESVKEIRSGAQKQKDYAKTFGVSEATISRVVLRQSWRHV